MHGNVYEWCRDLYDSGYYTSNPVNNPTGPGIGSSLAVCGGIYSSAERQSGCLRYNCIDRI